MRGRGASKVGSQSVCRGQSSGPLFLGRYRPTTSPPPGFPNTCPARETKTSPLCRFEVIVRDNDGNVRPSKGDFFSIKLSSATAITSELDPATVFYATAGFWKAGTSPSSEMHLAAGARPGSSGAPGRGTAEALPIGKVTRA